MRPSVPQAGGEPAGASLYKSRPGLVRVWRAWQASCAGLQAAWRHEAAFRQEVFVGLPMIAYALWRAADRWQALALIAPIVLVWTVELLNSAVEALADAVSLDHHPLLGRAKDLGSAAVLASIMLTAGVWALVLWP